MTDGLVSSMSKASSVNVNDKNISVSIPGWPPVTTLDGPLRLLGRCSHYDPVNHVQDPNFHSSHITDN